jgi:hypothetical protein
MGTPSANDEQFGYTNNSYWTGNRIRLLPLIIGTWDEAEVQRISLLALTKKADAITFSCHQNLSPPITNKSQLWQ